MATLEFDASHMYTYLKGFAKALGWSDTMNALPFARRLHDGQTRKDSQPYIVHPLTMACHAVALGVRDDAVVAALLLHDVCEDCGQRPEQLPVSDRCRDIVSRLTHKKGTPMEIYYAGIREDPESSLCKLFDRCHNVSSMAGAFSDAKAVDYIDEANIHVMPLVRVVKEARPEYSDVLFVLKYHIQSVAESMAAVLPPLPARKDEGGKDGKQR